MMLSGLLLWILVVLYSLAIIRRWRAWRHLPEQNLINAQPPQTFLSVIIPVRNEARNIRNLLRDLEQQTYPNQLFEVLVVDDHSDDGTAEVVFKFQKEAAIAIRLIQLPKGKSGKKTAVKAGILQASGTLLAFTDGDCRVQPDWLALLEQTYRVQQAKFISGPVCLTGTRFFEKMQVVEFASLIGIGAASIGLRSPNMCNGANLAYEKAAFTEVNGFTGNEHIASGDDEFLMHKIAEKWPERVCFLKASEATVYTPAQPNLKSFLAQRIRWASKWKSYQNLRVQSLALLVFLVNLGLFVALPLIFFGKLPAAIGIGAYLVKFAVDCLFLIPVLQFLKQEKQIGYIFLIQLFYLPYVVLTAVAGLVGNFTWKGRSIKN